ncbi:hypothetical protein [uncultured Aquimarina sp.]|uniref:hypothetical protein n=1 Tax=uncultured Aquimarina sp. TaxID=575652 RepID=UPI0026144273|nr:hypothetical protein [uncultured Aquimarina sp.]
MNRKELFVQVDMILWEEWDPIGVNNYGGPSDEYTGYVPSVVKLILDGSDIAKITKLLQQHSNVNMGMTSKLGDHKAIAIKLHTLVDK